MKEREKGKNGGKKEKRKYRDTEIIVIKISLTSIMIIIINDKHRPHATIYKLCERNSNHINMQILYVELVRKILGINLNIHNFQYS